MSTCKQAYTHYRNGRKPDGWVYRICFREAAKKATYRCWYAASRKPTPALMSLPSVALSSVVVKQVHYTTLFKNYFKLL